MQNENVYQEGKGLWLYPQKPSVTQRKLFCELVRLSREEYKIEEGPILELRLGHYWIDCAWILTDYHGNIFKLALEIDGPIHNTRKIQDARKDKYLQSRGWRVIRIPVSFIDNNCEHVARGILDEIVKITDHQEYIN
jgi:hypothetical protein